MSTVFLPGIGATLSADIAVPEHARELRFYASVLGSGAQPLWRDDLMNNLGMPIIGLGERKAEYAHLPLQWMPHIQVADVAASAQRAIDLGGRELMHAKDDAGCSQWAVLQDPDGAAFGIIPIVPSAYIRQGDGSELPEAGTPVGRIGWIDLTVADAPSARDFYHQVVQWPVQEVEMKDGDEDYVDYGMLAEDGNPAAGICHARGSNAGLPPVWLIHLTVGDLEQSLRRVKEEGGEVVKASRGKDGAYRTAVIRDPVGVHLALMAA